MSSALEERALDASATDASVHSERFFAEHLLGYRDVVIEEMRRVIAAQRFQKALARQLAEYPLRAGKGLRPALCLATCQAFGGGLPDALPSAVALELFHNAFLVHDDIEDESVHRRGSHTIHQKYGVAIAINVGDALNVLAMTQLLENLRVIGLARTLRIFSEIERMARESVDGQAMELEWVKRRAWRLTDRHYYVMTRKKTGWYTCVAPCRIGALIGGASGAELDALVRFGVCLGVAFQIRDDLLNLMGEDGSYGKEIAGDIWEGKRTLMLINLMRQSGASERQELVRIMSKARQDKTEDEVLWVLAQMRKYRCLEYGHAASTDFAVKARTLFARVMGHLPDTPHKRFLEGVIDYVIRRTH
jgi:geranylgeranyl diphosphate synthase, type II